MQGMQAIQAVNGVAIGHSTGNNDRAFQTAHLLMALGAITFIGGVVAAAVVGRQYGAGFLINSLSGKLMIAGTGTLTIAFLAGAFIASRSKQKVISVANSLQPQISEAKKINYLSKKYLTLWHRAVAKRKELRGCPLGPPPLEAIQRKLVFVHATNVFPSNGILRAGTLYTKASDPSFKDFVGYRVTVHFALGSLVLPHEKGDWEEHKYAVLSPYAPLSSQLINVFPYDSFALGDVQLTSQMTLIIPENEREALSLPNHVRVVTYKQGERIRNVIDRCLKNMQAWQIKMMPESIAPKASIDLFNRCEVCSPEFFQSILRGNPALSFGSALTSLSGQAWRIKHMDVMLGDCYRMKHSNGVRAFSVSDNLFLQAYFAHQARMIEHYYGKENPYIKRLIQQIDFWTQELRKEVLDRKLDSVREGVYGYKKIADSLACMGEEEFKEFVHQARLDSRHDFHEMTFFYYLLRWMYFGKECVQRQLEDLTTHHWDSLKHFYYKAALIGLESISEMSSTFRKHQNDNNFRDEVKVRCQEILDYLDQLPKTKGATQRQQAAKRAGGQ